MTDAAKRSLVEPRDEGLRALGRESVAGQGVGRGLGLSDGRKRHLGFFTTEEQAHNAYLVAKREERRAILEIHNAL